MSFLRCVESSRWVIMTFARSPSMPIFFEEPSSAGSAV
jgi:hypothetical protein